MSCTFSAHVPAGSTVSVTVVLEAAEIGAKLFGPAKKSKPRKRQKTAASGASGAALL